jgi:hypothetical protein
MRGPWLKIGLALNLACGAAMADVVALVSSTSTSANPAAIGYIDAELVDDSVRVLY